MPSEAARLYFVTLRGRKQMMLVTFQIAPSIAPSVSYCQQESLQVEVSHAQQSVSSQLQTLMPCGVDKSSSRGVRQLDSFLDVRGRSSGDAELLFQRAKKNQEELRRSNPQNPVLRDEDERFLERTLSQERPPPLPARPQVTAVTDEGEERPASRKEESKAQDGDIIVPETQPKSPVSPSDAKKPKDNPLPSQEEAEAVTRSWNSAVKLDDDQPHEKRTWASYIPNAMRPASSKESSTDQQPDQRTWTEFAASYVPTRESLPAWLDPANWKPKDPDAKPEPVLNEDGSINEEKTKEKQEKEVSVLLDNLNMSTVNNRVFAFSKETEKYYERFAQCLKDTMNGVPTAYDDMDKLMREAGPTLEKQFKSMPPFVQTLVKSLPAKLGASLAPELLAASSEKPGADAKVKLEEASKKSAQSGAGVNTPSGSKEKSKRKVPGMKKLVQGGQVLMFVFWYCHKRGRETRLAKEREADIASMDGQADDDDENDVSDSDQSDPDTMKMDDILNQPNPSEVPLPKTDTGLEEK
ncbi:uncharacterized protein MYCFIDRAFT_85031 [Pseudocercospora fijiensis CIRAD86]|uniref:Uncharacterized protein n=1 Tax=Pseudocercospora fijiensis (strain CIRAD86) TaxID=383855 RepID=N1Q7F0_PSEFD|nr:uncharacterized protein MYCFIDRAFT_85031 [Pseudocercospora fijiensis CIRAD86]EME88584.1 hypothetical protein MYCFIDRAFT_85031 [Pseudocercospora fijiensis CIRAD86]